MLCKFVFFRASLDRFLPKKRRSDRLAGMCCRVLCVYQANALVCLLMLCDAYVQMSFLASRLRVAAAVKPVFRFGAGTSIVVCRRTPHPAVANILLCCL